MIFVNLEQGPPKHTLLNRKQLGDWREFLTASFKANNNPLKLYCIVASGEEGEDETYPTFGSLPAKNCPEMHFGIKSQVFLRITKNGS